MNSVYWTNGGILSQLMAAFLGVKIFDKYWDFLGCNENATDIVRSETGEIGKGIAIVIVI